MKLFQLSPKTSRFCLQSTASVTTHWAIDALGTFSPPLIGLICLGKTSLHLSAQRVSTTATDTHFIDDKGDEVFDRGAAGMVSSIKACQVEQSILIIGGIVWDKDAGWDSLGHCMTQEAYSEGKNGGYALGQLRGPSQFTAQGRKHGKLALGDLGESKERRLPQEGTIGLGHFPRQSIVPPNGFTKRLWCHPLIRPQT